MPARTPIATQAFKGLRLTLAALTALALPMSAVSEDCLLVERTHSADVYECCEEECDERTLSCGLRCDEVALITGIDDDAEFARLKWAVGSEDPTTARCGSSGIEGLKADRPDPFVAVLVCCTGCEGSDCWNCSPAQIGSKDPCPVPDDKLMNCKERDKDYPDYSGCKPPATS